jgi:hypothetical protein
MCTKSKYDCRRHDAHVVRCIDKVGRDTVAVERWQFLQHMHFKAGFEYPCSRHTISYAVIKLSKNICG